MPKNPLSYNPSIPRGEDNFDKIREKAMIEGNIEDYIASIRKALNLNKETIISCEKSEGSS